MSKLQDRSKTRRWRPAFINHNVTRPAILLLLGLVSLSLSRHLQTLDFGVEEGAHNKLHEVGERDPEVGRKEVLGNNHRDGRDNPGHLQDRHESSFHSSGNGIRRPGTVYHRNAGQIDKGLNGGDEAVTGQQLANLGLWACLASKRTLERTDKGV